MKDPMIVRPVLWLLLSICSAGGMAFYVTEIWGANQPPYFTDFYAPWWGSHEMLIHRRNPYSPAVAHEIQTVIYGAQITSSSPNDPSNIAGGFAYPPYVALLLWPTLYLSFSVAQKVFLCVSVLVTLIAFALWLRALRLRLSTLSTLTLAFFVLGSFPVLQGIKLQNLSMIAAALLAATMFLLAADKLMLAGIFLAASTFKPQFTIALVPWLALWTLGDWRRRRALAGSFLTTMMLLALCSEYLAPGWISRFVSVIQAYRQYTYGHSLFDVWFTRPWGQVVGACLLLAVLAFSWRRRRVPAESERFFLITSFVLAATVVVIPTLAPHAQLLLIPGVLCLFWRRALLLSSGLPVRLVLVATWVLLGWPWVAAFFLSFATLWYPALRLLRFWQVPLYTSPLLPLAVMTALGCLLRTGYRAGDADSVELANDSV